MTEGANLLSRYVSHPPPRLLTIFAVVNMYANEIENKAVYFTHAVDTTPPANHI